MSFLTRLPRAAPALKRAYATVADASGVKVAGVESGAPAATSSVTVVVKAGSRYETKPGAAHVLKSFAFKVGPGFQRCSGGGGGERERVGGIKGLKDGTGVFV